jgi:hypothetical protein
LHINTVSHLRRPQTSKLYGLRIMLTWQQMTDIPVFWDKTVESGKQAPTFQNIMAQLWIEKPEDGGSRFLQNVSINISHYLA